MDQRISLCNPLDIPLSDSCDVWGKGGMKFKNLTTNSKTQKLFYDDLDSLYISQAGFMLKPEVNIPVGKVRI